MALTRLLGWRDVLERDIPDFKVCETSTKEMRGYAPNSVVGDVRLACGMFYTDAEYVEMRAKELAKPLP